MSLGVPVPDRDFVARTVRRPFRASARLWLAEGASAATTDSLRRALAEVLRENGPIVAVARSEARRRAPGADPALVEGLACTILVSQQVLGPVRPKRLANMDFAEEAREALRLHRSLSQDVAHLARSVVDGRRPRALPRPRARTTDVLARRVAIQL
jgi:hypothetical protein